MTAVEEERRARREAGLTVVEMTIVILIIIILAAIAAPPILKFGSTGRIRSGGMTAFSILKSARSRAITEGISVHVKYGNTGGGAMIEAVRVNPSQADRFASPDWNDADNEILGSAVLDGTLEWAVESYLYFRPDGSAPASATLRLQNQQENDRYMELFVYAGSGLVETGDLHDE
ncbi:MAG: hypothetical protein JW909_06430 [Planctomycetes bacterium]|nr:hypothetical protein [Planctomycetota bacterium]